jgi:hypothetical protein
MDPIQKRELKRQAWMRLAAQRRRAGLLRGRVVAISLICFALLWGIVFAQMATGNDPVLSAKEKATAGSVASTRRKAETAGPPDLRLEREVAKARELEEELFAAESEPEEEEFVEGEPEFEEEFVEEEPEFEEPVEVEEPLVTSQS